MNQWKAESLLFLVTAIWGATFLFTKIGLEYCSFSLYMVLRFSIALILALVFFGKNLKKINKKLAKGGFVLGFFFGLGFVLQTYGLKFTAVSNSAFITGLTVAITPFVAFVLIKTKIKKTSIIGVVLAFAGMTLFTNPFSGKFNIGDLVTLGSTFCWAFYITYMDIYTKDSGKGAVSVLLIFQLAVSLIMAVMAFFIFDYSSVKFIPETKLWVSLLFNGIVASFLVTLIHTASQRFTTPVKAALIFVLEPVCATIYALIFFNENIDVYKIVGGSIMLFGIMVSELAPMLLKRRAKAQV